MTEVKTKIVFSLLVFILIVTSLSKKQFINLSGLLLQYFEKRQSHHLHLFYCSTEPPNFSLILLARFTNYDKGPHFLLLIRYLILF